MLPPNVPPLARRAGRAVRWAARALGVLLAALLAFAAVRAASAQTLLVPMDDAQRNHLRAYGLVYNALKDGQKGEWLLNYRGGAYFLPDLPELRRRAALAGVTVEPLGGDATATVRREVAGGNMDAVPLEKAPKVAIYTPPGAQPWDDAVTLALTYAGIPFEKVWDDEVLAGKLSEYEWVHLFHEDFTGQQNKLYLGYSGAPWFVQQRQLALAAAQRHALGLGARAQEGGGGARAAVRRARRVPVRDVRRHRVAGPRGGGAGRRLRRARPSTARRSTRTPTRASSGRAASPSGRATRAAVHQRAVRHRRAPGERARAPAAARHVPALRLLGQVRPGGDDARAGPPRRARRLLRRDHVVHEGDAQAGRDRARHGGGAPWVKYIHGDYGKGAWTFLGGHDPEDPQHAIGSPPTDLSLHPNSPGYRLILNNVLFPAAKKKPLKT
jgi:hypothetical protein